MKRTFCAAAVAALALFAVPVSAQVTKVAVKALRVPHDYKSIQKALDEADPGDTVFVDEGTYKESIVLRDDIVLIGASAERVIIKGDRKKPVITGAQGAEVRHVTVENGHSGILCANVIMIIENCVIRGNRGTGIHCLISLPVIRGNVIFRNASSGVYCETTRSHRGYVANNVIAENGVGLTLAGQSEVLVENNVIYFNKQYGIFTSEGARKSRIIYNALYGNRQQYNNFTTVNNTNIQQDPGYAEFGADVSAFWNASPEVLRGRGKEGKDIGPQKRVFYKLPQAKAATATPVAPAPPPPPPPKPPKAEEKATAAPVPAPANAVSAVNAEAAPAPVPAPANAVNAEVAPVPAPVPAPAAAE